MKKAVLIAGATSAIARAIAQELASQGHDLILAARDEAELQRIAGDLRVRWNIQATAVPFDASDLNARPTLWSKAIELAGGEMAGVVVAHGAMSPQADAQRDWEIARRMIDTNYSSAAQVLGEAANYFEPLKRGFLCGISSVAGDRGRQSNYLYGSSKAALSSYLSGLRNRLARSGVAVITVKPGFVDTAMTWGLPGMFLVASPQKVAADVAAAIRKGRSEIYTPWFWRYIMLIIRSIPEPIFKWMKL